MIEIQGLSIFYGKRKLAYPDISVKKGEAVGIAGKSGCGKTSLFSFLLGELPDSAFSYERAELLGRDLSLWGMERFEKISYIPQFAQSALNPRMKVWEHIDAVLSACGRPGKRGGRGAVPETGSFRGAFFQISQYAVRGAEAEDRDRPCDAKRTGAPFYG